MLNSPGKDSREFDADLFKQSKYFTYLLKNSDELILFVDRDGCIAYCSDAMLRAANAFGLDGAVLSTQCADAYSPKVVRSGMGAHFRLPIIFVELHDAISRLRAQKTPVYAACSRREGALALGRDTLPDVFSVIIGNEAEGVSESLIGAADGSISIPMPGGAESLNAASAAAIIMWEMTKNR